MRSSSVHTIEVLTFPHGLEGIIQVHVGSVDSVTLAAEVAISLRRSVSANGFQGTSSPERFIDETCMSWTS